MAEPNVTMMVITADLQCEKCYKKIKKVLCILPQIRDQVYDEKHNTVTIKVVCCKPEKIMQKIRCQGDKCVKNIKIKPPPDPPKPDPKPVAQPAPCCPPLVAAFPFPVAAFPIGGCCRGCCSGCCRCYCEIPVYEDPYACSIM